MSTLLLCFRNVRRSLADSRGITQVEFWTKWSDVRSLQFSFCNTTGESRATISLDNEYLYIHSKRDSTLQQKLKEAHLVPYRPAILFIDDYAVLHEN